jgi:hypothetical protein
MRVLLLSLLALLCVSAQELELARHAHACGIALRVQ